MVEFHRVRRFHQILKRKRDVASREREKAFGVMSARFYRDFWERTAAVVGAEVEELSGDVFLKIKKGPRWTYVKRHWVMLDTWLTRQLVDDKALIHDIGAEYGWKAPRHLVFDYLDVRAARRFMEEVGTSVVLKPAGLGRGDGITTRIDNHRHLARATSWASSFSRTLIVEEFVEGENYRLLFLDGELVARLHREPPSVIGDGKSTIRELIRLENESRIEGKPYKGLIPLTLDLECELTLLRQGLAPSSVPADGERIRLKSVINQNASKENHTVTREIHPSTVALGKKLAAVLNLKLFGLDVLTRDPGASLKETGGVVLEMNTQPGLHYHDLVSDPETRVPIGELILKSIFSRTDPRWCE